MAMKVIKDINKLIVRKVVEIIFVLSFVFYSTSIWVFKTPQNTLSSTLALATLNYTKIQIEEPQEYSIYPMKDTVALRKQNTWSVNVINNTIFEESYLLVLNYSKSSTIDYSFINISVGQDVFSLDSLPMEEIGDNYYFILDEDTIQSMTKSYEIRVWLKEETENDMQAKQLIMSFEIINGVASV